MKFFINPRDLEYTSMQMEGYEEFKAHLSRPLLKNAPFHYGLIKVANSTFILRIELKSTFIALNNGRLTGSLQTFDDRVILRSSKHLGFTVFNQSVINRRKGRKTSSLRGPKKPH